MCTQAGRECIDGREEKRREEEQEEFAPPSDHQLIWALFLGAHRPTWCLHFPTFHLIGGMHVLRSNQHGVCSFPNQTFHRRRASTRMVSVRFPDRLIGVAQQPTWDLHFSYFHLLSCASTNMMSLLSETRRPISVMHQPVSYLNFSQSVFCLAQHPT